MTAKLLLVKSENGLETRQDYDGLSSANPAFTGTLTGGSAALTGGVDAGGEFKSDALAGAGTRPVVALADGTIDDQPPATFLGTIGALSASLKGSANGVAELGADGRVLLAQLPSYVDEVVEYPDFASFPTTGEDGKIYVAIDDGTSWRWSGTIYAQISSSLTLGSTASTAHRGDHGVIAYNHSQLTTGNPHGTTAAQVGAEPYAGTPAQTSFWRSTAAGVRAWVQLVAADITDLATTLAAYLTKNNPTFTGRLSGNDVKIGSASSAGWLQLLTNNTGTGTFNIDFLGGTSSNRRMTFRWSDSLDNLNIMTSNDDGSARLDRVLIPRSSALPIAVAGGLNVSTGDLSVGGVAIADASRNIIGASLKGGNLAGTGNRPMVAGADGTIDDQDAATFRGTIGALAATDPVFTGALKQGATTRITAGGGAWFASMQATNLVGAGDRPVAADLTGTLQPKTPDQFRNMISALSAALKGAANGVAELGADGRVPTTQLPSYVDDVLEYATFSAFPATGETGKIYVNLDQNKTWRWSGSAYVEISASLALGETSATAHRGDHGVIAYNHSQATGNPHGTTAADVGAAPAAHNHFSKLDVSASTTLGSIDASAIKVTTTDVILTLSGGVDGQGWDIINPTASTGIAIPSGATLWKSIGSNVGPTTIALGGGRPIRITRIDANTWIMLGSQ